MRIASMARWFSNDAIDGDELDLADLRNRYGLPYLMMHRTDLYQSTCWAAELPG